MRIALLAWESLHSISVGGGAVHVSELATALAKAGHDVHVFTRIAPGQDDYACVQGVHYYRTPYKGHHEFVDEINNMCRAFVQRLFGVEDSTGKPFEIVHAHDWLCANAMIWIKKGRKRAGILTIHATEYARCGNVFHDGRSARVRDQERAGCDWADRVISVSGATRDEVKWMYEVPDWKAAVVYNGVNRKRFDREVDVEAVRRRYHIGPMDPVVFFCGRLAYQKGPDILLEAFPAAHQRYPHAKLLYAGDGSMRGQLERRARELGLADAVRFMGYRGGDELVDLFKISDVVAVPSRNEPFGIVVLEAWSASKPVIVTQIGGPAEYVQHELNGLRVYENPNSVGWGMKRIFDDFDFARRMGRKGREAVEMGFTWDIVAQQTVEVYKAAANMVYDEGLSEAGRERESVADEAPGQHCDPELVALTDPSEPDQSNGRASPAHGDPVDVTFILDDASGELDVASYRTALLNACDELGCILRERADAVLEVTGPWEQVMTALQRLAPLARDVSDRLKLQIGLQLVQQQRDALKRKASALPASGDPNDDSSQELDILSTSEGDEANNGGTTTAVCQKATKRKPRRSTRNS